MKQVILFLSGKSDFCTIKKFDKLSIMNRDDANDTIFLYHQKEQEVPDTIKSVPHYTFTSDMFQNMGKVMSTVTMALVTPLTMYCPV